MPSVDDVNFAQNMLATRKRCVMKCCKVQSIANWKIVLLILILLLKIYTFSQELSCVLLTFTLSFLIKLYCGSLQYFNLMVFMSQ